MSDKEVIDNYQDKECLVCKEWFYVDCSPTYEDEIVYEDGYICTKCVNKMHRYRGNEFKEIEKEEIANAIEYLKVRREAYFGKKDKEIKIIEIGPEDYQEPIENIAISDCVRSSVKSESDDNRKNRFTDLKEKKSIWTRIKKWLLR